MIASRLLRTVLKWIQWLLFGLTVLFFLSLSNLTAQIRILYLFNIIGPIILVANFVMIAIWIPIKWKRSLYSLGPLLLFFSYWAPWINIAGGSSEAEGLSVLTYNVQAMGKNNEQPFLGDSMVSFIQSKKPSIVCLQEFYTSDNDDYRAQLKLLGYDYKWTIRAQKGDRYWANATFTNLPIHDAGYLSLNAKTYAVYTTLIAQSDTFTVLNTHLWSNRFSKTDVEEGLPKMAGSKRISARLYRAFKVRRLQADSIRQWKKRQTHPVVICGDFNDTPLSYTYRKIRGNSLFRSGMYDAVKSGGRGLNSTYNGFIPFQRIDHVLVDREIEVNSYQRFKKTFSDHYPILCSFNLKES